jgi:hypothetical protein
LLRKDRFPDDDDDDDDDHDGPPISSPPPGLKINQTRNQHEAVSIFYRNVG